MRYMANEHRPKHQIQCTLQTFAHPQHSTKKLNDVYYCDEDNENQSAGRGECGCDGISDDEDGR